MTEKVKEIKLPTESSKDEGKAQATKEEATTAKAPAKNGRMVTAVLAVLVVASIVGNVLLFTRYQAATDANSALTEQITEATAQLTTLQQQNSELQTQLEAAAVKVAELQNIVDGMTTEDDGTGGLGGGAEINPDDLHGGETTPSGPTGDQGKPGSAAAEDEEIANGPAQGNGSVSGEQMTPEDIEEAQQDGW